MGGRGSIDEVGEVGAGAEGAEYGHKFLDTLTWLYKCQRLFIW